MKTEWAVCRKRLDGALVTFSVHASKPQADKMVAALATSNCPGFEVREVAAGSTSPGCTLLRMLKRPQVRSA